MFVSWLLWLLSFERQCSPCRDFGKYVFKLSVVALPASGFGIQAFRGMGDCMLGVDTMFFFCWGGRL